MAAIPTPEIIGTKYKLKCPYCGDDFEGKTSEEVWKNFQLHKNTDKKCKAAQSLAGGE